MYKKSFLLALILSSCHLAPTFAQQRVEKIDVLEGQKTYKNYVKNPSAIKNTNGTSVSSATIARDTDAADKLDGIASFNCDASAQNGYCLWQVSTINEGDKTGNCEVSATFKGDASLYSLRLTDGTNTLYDLPLKNQTDWGGASFNYPCGATRDVRLVQTTAGTAPAVNIGRIYYGPATNLVNASVITDMQEWTPTFNSGFSIGNGSSYFRWKREGKTFIGKGSIQLGSTSSMGSGNFTFTTPVSMDPLYDDNLIGGYSRVGKAFFHNSNSGRASSEIYEVIQSGSSTNTFFINGRTDTGTVGSVTPTFPAVWGSGDEIDIELKFEAFEWTTSSMAIQVDESLDMIGSVIAFAGSCPTNTLEANGATVSRATYSRLFAKIGTAHGSGDGSTTFHLPDYRGRFLRGIDGGTGRDPDAATRTAMNSGGSSGNNIGSVQGGSISSHTHTQNAHEHLTMYAARVGISDPGGLSSGNYAVSEGVSTNYYSAYIMQSTGNVANAGRTSAVTATNQNTGGSETRPLNAYVRFCVVFKGTNAPILVDENEMSVLYRHDSGQALTSLGVIKFNVKVKDDFDSYNPTTGVFTAPFAGNYEISYTLFGSATTSWEPYIRKNGTSLNRTRAIPTYSGGTSIVNNQSTAISSPYIVYLTKGETLDVYLGYAASAGTLYTNALDNWLTIKRVGN